MFESFGQGRAGHLDWQPPQRPIGGLEQLSDRERCSLSGRVPLPGGGRRLRRHKQWLPTKLVTTVVSCHLEIVEEVLKRVIGS